MKTWKKTIVETAEESSLVVLRLFGREPAAEEWRCLGRWAYAAAWLAEDRIKARELVWARLGWAVEEATRAAMSAGRGDADRYALVSAIARLPEAIETRRGPLADAVERAVEQAAARLAQDGATLRGLTQREQAAMAPRFGLSAFSAALLDVGPDRQVMLRESLASLEEALLAIRGPCPALRTLRLFLQAALGKDGASTIDGGLSTSGDPVATLGLWLQADLALLARKAAAYGAAWASAAGIAGDPLSRTLAGLATGAMGTHKVVDALASDPWALLVALAMTTEPEHAAALLECGAQAQKTSRGKAARSVREWVGQADRANDLERRLGISVVAPYEFRQGHREMAQTANLDLFSAWSVADMAEEARDALRGAIQKGIETESVRRQEGVRQAKASLESVQRRYDLELEAAREKLTIDCGPVVVYEDDEGAQRGCVYGFGAGCGVMGTYIAAGLAIGTGGMMGRIAPLVIAIAALPVGAAIVVQIAYGLRRAAREAEASRRRSALTQEFERTRREAEKAHRAALAKGREGLEEAESELATFERQLGPALEIAA